jgi:hypothetical protein
LCLKNSGEPFFLGEISAEVWEKARLSVARVFHLFSSRALVLSSFFPNVLFVQELARNPIPSAKIEEMIASHPLDFFGDLKYL